MGDVPWQAVFSEDLVPMVLTGTDFGQDWIARSIMTVMLAVALLGARPARAYYRPCLIVACVLASGLIGTLAWAGHAAAQATGSAPFISSRTSSTSWRPAHGSALCFR